MNEKLLKFATMEISNIFSILNSSKDGLSEREAKKRFYKYGPNILVDKQKFNIFFEFISHFVNPLIIILFIAAGISFFLGNITDAIIIICMIFLGIILDFFQEYSADKVVKKLIESVQTTTLVARNGKQVEIPVASVVVGDIVFLSSGDMVPADARIIETNSFFVDQSALTGESFPEEKLNIKLKAQSDHVFKLNNIIFRGTNVVSGSCIAIVINTGKDTEFGKIALNLSNNYSKSDFEKGINNFGFFLMKIIFGLVLFTFLINSILKHDYLISFLFAVTIAVGITPELLPMILSITMAFGSKKMAKSGVIVKRLSSIPNFGSMDVLCTDKTGTLTENKIEIVKYTDYLGKTDEQVLFFAYLNSTFQTGIKNPLDLAIESYRKIDIKGYEKVEEIPYDFYRKRLSVIVKHKDKILLITKGAPEEIFKCCNYCMNNGAVITFDRQIKQDAKNIFEQFSKDGFRVLAVAQKRVDFKDRYDSTDENEMIFNGFILLMDPPKKDVKNVLKELLGFGVETKIITGDNELVTKKICDEVGLQIKSIILGFDLNKFTDDALIANVNDVTIFARCSPDEKTRIIKAIKANNRVVGYLGDGINDAPALKAADVGISVNNAVDVAKEAAGIVLMHKNLSVIKDGIIEGRKTFGNTMKYIMVTLSSNFGNMLSAAGAVVFLPFLPMLPIQILLNNLIYDFSEVSIPLDNIDDDWIKRPKRWNISFIKKFMAVFGIVSSIFDFFTFYFLFYVLHVSQGVFQTAWFMESLATQILVFHVIRTKKLPILKSRASLILFFNSFICILIGWLIPFTWFGKKFKFEKLSLNIILIIIFIAFLYLIIAEITKRFFYKKFDF